jgi:hypothetical protein
MTIDKLKDIVIKLHDIARKVEQDISTARVASDIRGCADRLSDVVKAKKRKEQ